MQVARSTPMPRWKRVVDLVLCVLALPFLGMVTLVTTILMRLVSPGPVFFRQERVGYLGRGFMIYKFRTMKVGADTSLHRDHTKDLIGSNAPMMKMDNRGDSRLIPGAKWIRALGIDELPQLINVLRGEMSFVGPRPCVPYEYEHYLPWQRERFSTLPGLTGLWQVSGKNRTTFDQMIRLDIHYAHHKSPWMDTRIILRTPLALLQQLLDSRARHRAETSMVETGSGLPGFGSAIKSR